MKTLHDIPKYMIFYTIMSCREHVPYVPTVKCALKLTKAHKFFFKTNIHIGARAKMCILRDLMDPDFFGP